MYPSVLYSIQIVIRRSFVESSRVGYDGCRCYFGFSVVLDQDTRSRTTNTNIIRTQITYCRPGGCPGAGGVCNQLPVRMASARLRQRLYRYPGACLSRIPDRDVRNVLLGSRLFQYGSLLECAAASAGLLATTFPRWNLAVA